MEYQAIVTALSNFKLSLDDIAIINWFKVFSESGNLKKIVKNKKEYYWVFYPKVTKDIVQFHDKKYGCISKKFSKLVQEGVFERTCTLVDNKKRVFYRFTDNVKLCQK